jgi:hypothetical protein
MDLTDFKRPELKKSATRNSREASIEDIAEATDEKD